VFVTKTLLFAVALWLMPGHPSLFGDTVGVRILGLRGPGLVPEWHFKTKHGFKELTVPTRQPSELIEVEGDGKLSLYREVMSAGKPPTYQLAYELELPEGAKSVLIVALASGEEQRFLLIQDDVSTATFNEWLFINTSTQPISFRIGSNENAFVIEAKESMSRMINGESGKGIAVRGQMERGGEMKTIYSTYWPVRKNSRSIVIFCEVNNTIKVIKIADYLKGTSGKTNSSKG